MLDHGEGEGSCYLKEDGLGSTLSSILTMPCNSGSF